MFEVLQDALGEKQELWFMFFKRNQWQEAAGFVNISCTTMQ